MSGGCHLAVGKIPQEVDWTLKERCEPGLACGIRQAKRWAQLLSVG